MPSGRSIDISKSDDEFFKLGAFLLLDEQDEAQKIYDGFDEEQRTRFGNFPIFKFYKAAKEE